MLRYYVRIGSLAEIHVADSEEGLSPGRRVIVRTSRGVELGTVAASVRDHGATRPTSVRVLRPTTEQDELLLRRLERHKRQAVEACREALRACGSKAALLEVDQIFDGGTLIMHFLGPIDERAQAATEQVVEQYESVVRSRHFAKLLIDGCGPDCGTGESAGCGSASGGCGQCGIAKACKSAL
jgi:cell fate regulator YaaT (PSP1 superfamily)